MSLRFEYIPKASSKSVGYLEAIYVKKEHRRLGAAKKLYEAGELWAKNQGCTQIASDTCNWNNESILFHENLGFHTTDTLVHFIKKI